MLQNKSLKIDNKSLNTLNIFMSIKQKAINSTKWVTFSTAFQTVVQFLQIAILARILSPTVFGIVGISSTIITFFSMFANLGFSNSIIYKQESDRKILSTVFFVNILLGVIVFLTLFFISPLIVAFYHEPRLDKVIKISSSMFLIIYFGSIYSILLQKELKFKTVATIDISGSVMATTVTIILAYHGFEELSLVYGGLTLAFTRTILQLILGRKLFSPMWHFQLSEIKDHLSFGMYNFGEGIVSFIQGNWDNIIIGRMLGAKILGYYTLAYQLAIFPVNKINPIILQVAYPVLAKMKDDPEELKSSYLKILDIISYFNLPLLAGLFITAESIVPLIYGPGWEPTFPLIKIFVFVSILSCLSHPLFTLVYTKGKPNLVFYLNLVTLAAKIPLVYFLGKYYQVTGIAVAFLLSTFINMVLNFVIVQSLIGTYIKRFLTNFSKPIIFCLLMVGIVYLYKHFVGYVGLVNAFVEIAIGALIYFSLTLLFKFSYAEIKQIKKLL